MLADSFGMVMDLIMNLTFLISLTILSDFIDRRRPAQTLSGAVLQGLLFGTAAVMGMLRPLDFGSGLIFDGRSIMLSLAAWYYGPVSAFVASGMAIALRLSIGGSGVYMGVMVIVSSATIGLVSRRWLQPEKTPPRTRGLFQFGLAVHIAMIGWMLTLPKGVGLETFRRLSLPIITLYPLATILAGKILSDQIASRLTMNALRESEERFLLSMEATNDGLWDLDIASDRSYYSPSYYRMLGYEPGDFPATGAGWRTLVHPDDRERAIGIDRDCVEGRAEAFEGEYRMLAKNGEERWILSRGKSIERDATGRSIRLVGTHIDITERKEAEERLRRSLAEKEVLLREVHHRVKNNLNIISSLLNLQAGAIQNPQQALEGFQHSRERIMAMALVHEELYKSRDYASVDMGQYLADLVRNLSLGYGVENRIRIEASAIGVDLNVTSSIPCGLILNELIANAIKYAFPAGEQGEIRISLSKTGTGRVHMELSDDGVGLPRPFEELCDSEGASLGLVLVRLLVDQLEGTIEATVGQGTTYRIDFPEAV